MRPRLTAYLSLSALSGFVELGAIILVLRHQAPLGEVLVIGLCYQVGTLFKNPIHLSANLSRSCLVFAAVVGLLASGATWILGISVMLLAAGLQGIRDESGKGLGVSTVKKRTARVAGFACAGLFSYPLLPLVALGCLLASLVLGWQPLSHPHISVQRNWHCGWLGGIMTAHQSHYFCYAYLIPYLFASVGVSSVGIGLAFAAGWVSYTASHLIFGRLQPALGFILGHLLAASMLAGIILGSEHLVLLILTWIGTGFGGGTVFFLRSLNQSRPGNIPDLDLWENVGHVTGVLGALIINAFVARLIAPVGAASLIALSCCGLMILASYRASRARPDGPSTDSAAFSRTST